MISYVVPARGTWDWTIRRCWERIAGSRMVFRALPTKRISSHSRQASESSEVEPGQGKVTAVNTATKHAGSPQGRPAGSAFEASISDRNNRDFFSLRNI